MISLVVLVVAILSLLIFQELPWTRLGIMVLMLRHHTHETVLTEEPEKQDCPDLDLQETTPLD